MKKNVLALSIAAMIGSLGFAGRREDVVFASECPAYPWDRYIGFYPPPQPTHSAYQQVASQQGANHD